MRIHEKPGWQLRETRKKPKGNQDETKRNQEKLGETMLNQEKPRLYKRNHKGNQEKAIKTMRETMRNQEETKRNLERYQEKPRVTMRNHEKSQETMRNRKKL